MDQSPPATPPDIEEMARAARQARIAECERLVLEAIAPILAKYNCRLGTIQQVIDGRPGAVQLRVFDKI